MPSLQKQTKNKKLSLYKTEGFQICSLVEHIFIPGWVTLTGLISTNVEMYTYIGVSLT